jgi:two-component system cell cycle sensor histidine kinase/response regulator CckA
VIGFSAAQVTGRLAEVDAERRRLVVRNVSAAFAALSLFVVLQMRLAHPPAVLLAVNGGAAVGFGSAFLLAGWARGGTWGAVLFLVTMQLQHVGSALPLRDLSEVSSTVMFTGLIPLLAAATLAERGTLLASLMSLSAVSGVFYLQYARGLSPEAVGRALGPPLFFVLVGAVVALLTVRAQRGALRAQLDQEQARAQAEAAAVAAEERFRVVADQVSDLVAVLDARGDHIFASASYAPILKRDPGTLRGEPALPLVHEAERDAVAEAFARALTKEPRELVARLSASDGSFRSFHLRLVGVEIEGKTHVAMTAHDVTALEAEHREREAELRMDALARLAGGVAHDFNNLLSVISSSAAMVEHKLPHDPRALEDLRIIDDSVARAAALTGQLLAFARRQALPPGHTTPSAEIAELSPLLARALGTGVKLTLDVAGSAWSSALSRSQLEQILMNLTINARDAMPQGGTLHIRAQDRQLAPGEVADLAQGEYIEIAVTDTGSGMSSQVAARIFEPFFTTKAKGRGTGLGLATSFGVARQAGGTLSVVSQPGRGASFSLLVPRLIERDEPAVSEVKAVPSAGLSVLVVDDEPRIAELVTRMLELAGHHARSVSTATDALAVAAQTHFDAIFSDVVLGQDDGLDLLSQLRVLCPHARTIAVSGFAPSPEKLRALQQTGIGYLEKPFTLDALLGALADTRACRSA